MSSNLHCTEAGAELEPQINREAALPSAPEVHSPLSPIQFLPDAHLPTRSPPNCGPGIPMKQVGGDDDGMAWNS